MPAPAELCAVLHAKPRPASGRRGLMHSPHEAAATAGSGLQATPTSDQREDMALLAQVPHKLCGTTRAQPRDPNSCFGDAHAGEEAAHAVSPAEQVHTQMLPKQLHGHIQLTEELSLPQPAWHVHGCLVRAAAMHTHEQQISAAPGLAGACIGAQWWSVPWGTGPQQRRAGSDGCEQQRQQPCKQRAGRRRGAHVAALLAARRHAMQPNQEGRLRRPAPVLQSEIPASPRSWPNRLLACVFSCERLKRQAHTAHVCGSLRVLTMHGAMHARHAK